MKKIRHAKEVNGKVRTAFCCKEISTDLFCTAAVRNQKLCTYIGITERNTFIHIHNCNEEEHARKLLPTEGQGPNKFLKRTGYL